MASMTKEMKFLILINLTLNTYVWLVPNVVAQIKDHQLTKMSVKLHCYQGKTTQLLGN